MTAIKGFTYLILDGDAGEVNDEQREYLEIIRMNVDRLVALINDLLDISRIESGRIQLHLERIDLGEIAHSVVTSLKPYIDEKKQTLSVDIPLDLPQVRGDRDRMIQVLTNLLSNASKYTPTGGTIRIKAYQETGLLHVAVTDNGMGIAAADQVKLFTPFYRVDNSLTREIGGTGLGLSIVKSIVELHSGKIMVDSEPWKGSTFAFFIPIVHAATQPVEDDGVNPEEAALLTHPGVHKILVVEDNFDITTLIRLHLESAGFAVITAESGEQALSLIDLEPPDLIVLNIQLPGMNGFDLSAHLAEKPATQNIPVLVIPAQNDAERGLQMGLIDSLPKSIDQKQLIKTITHMLDKSAGRDVLVVDDDTGVQRLLGTALRKRGLRTFTALDGAVALEIIAQKPPSLILLDLGLPVINGFSVLQAIKQNPVSAAIPVIVITGSEGFKEGARARVLALGAVDFFTKPFDMERLIEEVRTLINKKED